MPLQIPNGYSEVAFFHSLTGSLHASVCTIGVNYTGSDFNNEANGLASAWGETIMQSMADVWTYTKATFRSQAGVTKERNTGFPGGTAHTPTTPNTTFLIRKITGLPGRRERGRMYLPGCSEQDLDGTGVVAPSKATEIAGHLTELIEAATDLHFAFVLFHNVEDLETESEAPTTIQELVVDGRAATQRRRMR